MRARYIMWLIILAGSFGLGAKLGQRNTPDSLSPPPSPASDVQPQSNAINQAAAEPESSKETARKLSTLEEIERKIQQAMAEPTDPLRRSALKRLAECVDLAMLPTLLPRLEKDWQKLVRQDLTQMLLRQWAQHDLPAALNYAQKLPPSFRRQLALETVAEEWIKQDEASALAWINAQPVTPWNRQLLRTMLTAMAEKAPARAWQFAETLQSPKRDLQNAILLKWAESDPSASARMLAAQPEKDLEILAKIARLWAIKDPEAAVAWVKTLPGANPLGMNGGTFMEGLAMANHAVATEYALSLPPGTLRDSALWHIASQLTQENLELAAQWRDQLPEGSPKFEADFLRAKASTNPLSALEEASQNPDPDTRNQLLFDLTQSWAMKEPQSAWQWLNQHTNFDNADFAKSIAFSGWGQYAPEAARDFALNMPESKTRDGYLQQLASMNAQINPQETIQWVQQVTSGSTRDETIYNVARIWTDSDPVAVNQWISQLPAGTTRDAATFAYALSIADTCDEASALQCLDAVGDSAKRLTGVEALAGNWADNDPVAAREWLESADLPADLKDRLLKRLDPEAP